MSLMEIPVSEKLGRKFEDHAAVGKDYGFAVLAVCGVVVNP